MDSASQTACSRWSKNDQLGECVDISGGSAIIGARYDDDLGNRSGSAYIFEHTDAAWTQHTKLNALDGVSSSNFGQDFAIHNGRVIVGAWGESDASGFFNAGILGQLMDGNSISNSSHPIKRAVIFMATASICTDNHAIIGADGNDDFWFGPDVGSAYMIEFNCIDPCRAVFTGDGLLNFFDVSAFLAASLKTARDVDNHTQ